MAGFYTETMGRIEALVMTHAPTLMRAQTARGHFDGPTPQHAFKVKGQRNTTTAAKREEILRLVEAGLSVSEIVKRTGVAYDNVRWYARAGRHVTMRRNCAPA